MDIKSLAEQYNDYIIDRRRYYHTCPELSGEEKNTRAHLKEDLEALGITDIHELETCYGLTATIHGGKPGKTVALRADIDALPVKEETGLPFASHNEGKMHACGHDNHMAMLLGAAKILNEVKDELSGDVRLVFQPAEETAVGALRMMEETGCDFVMVARAARGNPWLFRDLDDWWNGRAPHPAPSMAEKKAMMKRQLRDMIELKGEYAAVREMRSISGWYLRGVPGSAKMRGMLNRIDDADTWYRAIGEIPEERPSCGAGEYKE